MTRWTCRLTFTFHHDTSQHLDTLDNFHVYKPVAFPSPGPPHVTIGTHDPHQQSLARHNEFTIAMILLPWQIWWSLGWRGCGHCFCISFPLTAFFLLFNALLYYVRLCKNSAHSFSGVMLMQIRPKFGHYNEKPGE